MRAWPTIVGVYVTLQVPEARVHDAAGVKVPVEFVVKLTVPVGVIAPVPEVSVTVAVQVVPTLSKTLAGEQLTAVDVDLRVNVKLTVVELEAPVATALTVSVSVWAVGEVHVSTDVPPAGIEIDVTLRLQDDDPVGVTDNVTVFAKPPREATVIVEVPPGEPTLVVTVVGLALRLMPPEETTVTVTDMLAVLLVIRLFVPPVPVIVPV
jgi:hypothetical protein